MRAVLATVVMIGLLIAFGIAATPKASWHSADEPPSPAEQKAKQDEAIREAERDAHNRRVMGCVPEGVDGLSPKLFSALVDECERVALIEEANERALQEHEKRDEARIKEKWSTPPLYSDDDFAAEEAKAVDLEVSGAANDRPAPAPEQ